MKWIVVLCGCVGAVALGVNGCSSDSASSGAGGAAGAACAQVPKPDPKLCMLVGSGRAGGAAGGGGAGTGAGAGAGGAAGGAGASADCPNADPAYGDIVGGLEADDDDCKYHVVWSTTPVAVNQSVTLTVKLTSKADGKPVTGAAPRAELFIPCELTHPPPGIDAKATATEVAPGTYTVGPLQFDKPGRWAVRYHFFELCEDGETSPHGHRAFYVSVP